MARLTPRTRAQPGHVLILTTRNRKLFRQILTVYFAIPDIV